jgi:hypothetical protein
MISKIDAIILFYKVFKANSFAIILSHSLKNCTFEYLVSHNNGT